MRPYRARLATLAAATALAILAAAAGGPAAHAAVYLTQDKALALAFGDGVAVERQTAFLTEAQLASVRALAGPGIRVESALVIRYIGTDASGHRVGTAYFDTHRVRTADETLMIVVDSSGRASRVEVLAFAEPPEYLPKPGWLAQFLGHALADELQLKRGIRGIAGATLSSEAATEAVRRVLAIHKVIP